MPGNDIHPNPVLDRRALRVGMVAGEVSGDMLGSGLITAIREQLPGSEFIGVAGPEMIKAGCEPLYRAEELSVMGLAEVLQHLPRLLRLRKNLLRRLQDARIDIFVGIDSPDFNLPLAGMLKKSGVLTVQYVSPQVWAWRQSRVVGISKAVDLVLCLLPFETRFYEDWGVNARFVGHPLADEIPVETNKVNARASLGISAAGSYLAILPGSRMSEVSRLSRPFLETAKELSARRPDLRVIVGLANEGTEAFFSAQARDISIDPMPLFFTGRARDVMGAADVVLTASGTASLEVLLTKRPMVVAYIISGITHRLFRWLGLKRLDYFSLPNLLAGRQVVPEYLQGDVRPEILCPALEGYLDGRGADGQAENSDWYDTFKAIHQQLRRNASTEAASAVLGLLGNENDSA